ncbi:FG-GAP repeat domain-containing protein [Luteolibacter luteus]|uniref:Calx-beta domain-containing protein n=1 Tax=Luteolibacter luteus TaxID=2728835 RepID=A0A858RIW4_9BACT|nr:VCBS repeat-containing protein [Luteolibacter luteus]QJE96782.1 hypothetical protein HHL09_13645 [Luteolibacter luteus]
MTYSSFLRFGSLSLAFAATAVAVDSEVPTDPGLLTTMAGEPWNPPVSPGGAPFWGSGVFGTQIGQAGWVVAPGTNGPNIVVSGTTPFGFGPNNFWYVLNCDPLTQRYYQVYVQQPYAPVPGQYPFGEIAAMTSAQVLGGAGPELMVGLADGRFFFYSLTSFEEVRRLTLPTELTDFTTADLTGDGIAELVVLTDLDLKVFDAAGVLLWSITGPSGADLVVAQMDADPALEIATTSGHVIDTGKRKVEWTRSEGFGLHLRAADIDGDSRAELIAAADAYDIRAFDVEEKREKWSFRTGLDISGIEIADVDVDGDAAPELLYGDNQGGYLHVLTLDELPPVRKWKVANPDSGVARIATLDADQDGTIELIWSGGSNTSGEDRLNVFNPVTQATEWQSIHLDGPFLSPVMGDVTGDGKPEMVTISSESRSGYGAGCIVVYDPETLAILGVSQGIANDLAVEGVRDLILKDIDGDARQEIVVAGDASRDSLVEIYKFTDARTFERQWQFWDQNEERFGQVHVEDVDGDGDLEVVAASDPILSSGNDSFLFVIDLATKAVEWKITIPGGVRGACSLVVADVDGDGNLEAVVAMNNLGIQILDLKTRTREPWFGGQCSALAVRPGVPGFIAGSPSGMVSILIPDGEGGYISTDSWKASESRITGLTVGSGQSLWVSAQDRISLWPNSIAPIWSTMTLGTSFNDPVGTLGLYEGPEGTEVFAGLSHGLSGFQVGGSPDYATMQMSSQGELAEGSSGEIVLTFTRSEAGVADTAVTFSLKGNATAVADYDVSGAFSLGDDLWSVLIPAGETTVVARLAVVQDSLAEGPESLAVMLEPATGYFIGSSSSFETIVQDDEPVISVEAQDTGASELKSGRSTDPATFVLRRSGGDLSRSLVARIALGGSATSGSDYRRIGTNVTFRKGDDTAVVTVVPIHDRRAEQTETVQLELVPDPRYVISPSASQAAISILDAEPTVSVAGSTPVDGAVAVNFTRSGGHSFALPLTLKVTREENGVVKTTRAKLSFKARATSAQLLLKPSSGASGGALVTVQIEDTGAFHLGTSSSVSFTLDP